MSLSTSFTGSGTFGSSMRDFEKDFLKDQSSPIFPHQRWHCDFDSVCDASSSLHSLSNYRSINSPSFNGQRPEVMPVLVQNESDGPKYNIYSSLDCNSIKMFPDPCSDVTYSTRDTPIVDQGTLKQGRDISELKPDQQWILDPHHKAVSSFGAQVSHIYSKK